MRPREEDDELFPPDRSRASLTPPTAEKVPLSRVSDELHRYRHGSYRSRPEGDSVVSVSGPLGYPSSFPGVQEYGGTTVYRRDNRSRVDEKKPASTYGDAQYPPCTTSGYPEKGAASVVPVSKDSYYGGKVEHVYAQPRTKKPPPRRPPPPTEDTSTRRPPGPCKVEVEPGCFETLRGAKETSRAIADGSARTAMCWSCSLSLKCVPDCLLIICPDCRIVSPVEIPPDDVYLPFCQGVGLGWKRGQPL